MYTYKDDDQNFWNFVFALLYVILFAGSFLYLYRIYNAVPVSGAIPLFDFFLISLAIFRLTRLFVYDKITRFVRDAFVMKQEVVVDGEVMIERVKYRRGARRAISELLDCPWCIAVWMTLPIVFFYFYSQFAWYPIFALAVMGVAAFIQIAANALGWTAELLKKKANE